LRPISFEGHEVATPGGSVYSRVGPGAAGRDATDGAGPARRTSGNRPAAASGHAARVCEPDRFPRVRPLGTQRHDILATPRPEPDAAFGPDSAPGPEAEGIEHRRHPCVRPVAAQAHVARSDPADTQEHHPGPGYSPRHEEPQKHAYQQPGTRDAAGGV